MSQITSSLIHFSGEEWTDPGFDMDNELMVNDFALEESKDYPEYRRTSRK